MGMSKGSRAMKTKDVGLENTRECVTGCQGLQMILGARENQSCDSGTGDVD